MKSRAFTLIELLVVIAIIAILAAILFPVFAQAKASAKAAASVSNAKQHALAQNMYSTDYDDKFVIATAWNTGSDPLCFGASCFSSWAWLVQPYMKNSDLFMDPTTASIPPLAGFPKTAINTYATQYGYSYTYVNNYGWNGAAVPQPVSMTTPANVADTVMLTSKFSSIDSQNGGVPYTYGTWYYANGPMTINTVDIVHCATIPELCFGDWGTGGFWAGYLKNSLPVGAFTGGNSARATDNVVVAWADGHVTKKKYSHLGAGTNWTPTRTSSSVVINDLTKYVWDLQ